MKELGTPMLVNTKLPQKSKRGASREELNKKKGAVG